MEVIFLPQADKDLDYFITTNQKGIIKKISKLMDSIIQTPFKGIGKPEALKYRFTGKWSRKINQEHRLVYEFEEDNQIVYIYSLKGHYL
jgi:toxin YoeB